MAEEVKKNLVYLTKNLTNLHSVLLHCVQDGIITIDDKELIMAGETSLEKNTLFLDALKKRDWVEIKSKIITILRKTGNGHCADKIEHSVVGVLHSEKCQIQIILHSKWWPDVKHLPKAFLERKEEENRLIDILKENLAKAKSKSTVISQGVAVSGMGGVGKTTIAKWYAIEFQEAYEYIIWIDCGEENLLISFIDLAKVLNVDATLRLNLLSKKCFFALEKAKCLFIFDNAECYQGHQGIRDVLPKHDNFHTIITSRSKEWGSESGDGKIPEMHLNAFATRDSVQFLKKILKDELHTEDRLKKLSILLGNLPLALQIAVTVINTKKLSMDEYIQRIRQTNQNINQNFDDYEKTINKTMKISLDIIKNHEEDPKQTALEILLILGYIKPDLVEFRFFQAIKSLPEFEIVQAMELLEKYSLVTICSNVFTNLLGSDFCSIHRLLQQVIRHNNKVNEKIILKKILSVEGFPQLKLLPYLYADQETQSLFPELRAQLVDQDRLVEFVEQRRFSEAVELSRMIKDSLKTLMAWYNYAVCLEKKDYLITCLVVLKLVQNYLQSERNNEIEDIPFDDHLEIANIIDENINEDGIWDLDENIHPELLRGLLFLVYSRLGLDDAAHEVINQDRQLITFKTSQSLDGLIKYLKSPSACNYRLESGRRSIVLKLGNNYGKKISLEEFSVSEDLPNDIDHLKLKCIESSKFRIRLNGNFQFCRSIILENCIILLQNGRGIIPTEIDLRRNCFMQNDKEIQIVCLNDLIDFQQIKKLTLHGSNMWMKLDESLCIDKIFLEDFNSLSWNYLNCAVKELMIRFTEVPLLDKHIALRVNKLHLKNCSANLTSLYFLSQTVVQMHLENCTIKTDEITMKRKLGIYAANVNLNKIKFILDSVQVTEIHLSKILDFSKIKRLAVWSDKNTTMTFDLSQQFSMEQIDLIGVQLTNWDKSRSSVNSLALQEVDIRGILSTQFRVTEILDINNSVLDVTSLGNISASTNRIFLSGTSIHLNANLEPNIPKYYINGKVKGFSFNDITVFKDGEKVENLLVNEFINISQLNTLGLTSENESSRIIVDMQNITLSLDSLFLRDVLVLNWNKGEGHADEMKLWGIPFTTRNNIKTTSLVFGESSIDLSCLPKTIQTIYLSKESAVTCKAPIAFNDLHYVILDYNPSELKYFVHCPNLSRVELIYSPGNDQFRLNLQWIPIGIKLMKLYWGDALTPRPPPLSVTGITGNCPFKMDTFIIDGFQLSESQVASVLDALHPENVIFFDNYVIILTQAMVNFVIKLIESYKSVTIGPFLWESDEHFQKSPISKFVDGKGELYIFENRRGRVIQQKEFNKMKEL